MMREKVDTRSEERKEIVLGAELGGLEWRREESTQRKCEGCPPMVVD